MTHPPHAGIRNSSDCCEEHSVQRQLILCKIRNNGKKKRIAEFNGTLHSSPEKIKEVHEVFCEEGQSENSKLVVSTVWSL